MPGIIAKSTSESSLWRDPGTYPTSTSWFGIASAEFAAAGCPSISLVLSVAPCKDSLKFWVRAFRLAWTGVGATGRVDTCALLLLLAATAAAAARTFDDELVFFNMLFWWSWCGTNPWRTPFPTATRAIAFCDCCKVLLMLLVLTLLLLFDVVMALSLEERYRIPANTGFTPSLVAPIVLLHLPIFRPVVGFPCFPLRSLFFPPFLAVGSFPCFLCEKLF